ncbi:GNAT superfamily N-acetyltransferase [Hamadaea flava]|uniref:GNAT family N-acetyltransferase n=1 Tax=Hamadaea flava TaxID=1742688 RepID=A0ABV8LS34_9ACTN|nr:GNAT family N-acetyltransferase [Hamadaea flava]MCP2322288.1 GNAT superfamily N-acetyltransferase [Hamadaea flava]
MGDWTLRPATAADVDAVAELRAVVMRPDLERLGRYDEHRVRQRLRERWVPEDNQVIEVGGVFGGNVALRLDEDGHWLENFYLDPSVQGRGVGSAVLEQVLSECDSRVRLQVLQGSPARRLYERHGFTAYAEDAVDVWMVRQPR